MMGWWGELSAFHERLKHRIHNFRLPLNTRGQQIMGVIYFSVPVLGGYAIMQWAAKKAEQNFRLRVRTTYLL